MKILLLIDGMGIGGAETHVLTLARALVKRGVRVDVMCEGGVYTDALRNAGISVRLAPFKKRDFFSILKSIRILRRCRTEGYTVIHAHTRFTAALADFCLPKIPLVTTVHLDFSLTAATRTLSCWGRKALAVSPDLKSYLMREYGVKSKNILITRNGIAPEEFSLLPMRGKDVLHVSRLDKDRSLTALLLCKIAPALHWQYPNLKIRIYGNGNDFENVATAAIRANKLAGAEVIFLGGRTHNVASILKSAKIFVGVSRAALEATCRGIPVILSGNDGYGSLLTEDVYEMRKNDNFCCRGCEMPSETRLFSDLCYLLNHACFCENIRLKLSTRVRLDYAPEHMAKDALAAYYGALRIGIIGYYGFGNFGDEMMLNALCKKLTALGIETILPLKRKGEKNALSRRRPLRTVRMLRKCDYVLFGGGNLLQNETSPRSFFYYAILILLCRKKSLIGVGMGIGDLHGKFFKILCARLLRRFSALYFRTATDAAYALRLTPAISDRAYASCDVCLYLTEHAGILPRKKKILVIPKQSRNRILWDFLKEKRDEGYEIVPLCLFPDQDATVAKKIANLCGTSVREVQSAQDFFDVAADAQICFSERLHGAVFSLLAHTPCLIFSESTKCIAFAKDVALAAQKCGTNAPIVCVRSKKEARQKEREAKGFAFGFSDIIMFLRNR